MKNKFILILLFLLSVCSQVIKSNTYICHKYNTKLNNDNNLQNIPNENVGAKLKIQNIVTNMSEKTNITYSLRYQTYNHTNKNITDAEADNLTIQNVTHIVSNEFYLSQSNNYTFQMNVNHTTWYNIKIDKNKLSENRSNFSNNKIVEYLFYFKWIFNMKSKTFKLQIKNKFKFKLSFIDANNNNTIFDGDGLFTQDTILSYSFKFNSILPSIDNSFSDGEIAGIIVLGIISAIFIVWGMFGYWSGRIETRETESVMNETIDRNLLSDENEIEHELESSISDTEEEPLIPSSQITTHNNNAVHFNPSAEVNEEVNVETTSL